MKTFAEKSDIELKTDVLTELKFEPSVVVTEIGVLVKDGVVTLNGFATSYGEKWNAVHAAKRVAGVVAIADDIEVRLPNFWERSDADIAAAVANRLDWSTAVPEGAVQIMVRDGWITLEGELEWWYQKSVAENAVRDMAGVKGVANLITIRPRFVASAIETAIEAAFERNAVLDAAAVRVETSQGKVTLSGNVRSHSERDEAQRIACAAPGVFSVDNQITVESSPGFGNHAASMFS